VGETRTMGGVKPYYRIRTRAFPRLVNLVADFLCSLQTLLFALVSVERSLINFLSGSTSIRVFDSAVRRFGLVHGPNACGKKRLAFDHIFPGGDA